MTRIPRTLGWVTVAALAWTALVACSADVEQVKRDGPLTASSLYSGPSGDEPGNTGGWEPREMPMDVTANAGNLVNRGDETVTITNVSLVKARDWALIEAVLFPWPKTEKSGFTNYYPGYAFGYPQPDRHGRKWSEHRKAVGATIKPGGKAVMAVGLRASRDGAVLERIRIEYRDESGQKYETFCTDRFVVGTAEEISRKYNG